MTDILKDAQDAADKEPWVPTKEQRERLRYWGFYIGLIDYALNRQADRRDKARQEKLI